MIRIVYDVFHLIKYPPFHTRLQRLSSYLVPVEFNVPSVLFYDHHMILSWSCWSIYSWEHLQLSLGMDQIIFNMAWYLKHSTACDAFHFQVVYCMHLKLANFARQKKRKLSNMNSMNSQWKYHHAVCKIHINPCGCVKTYNQRWSCFFLKSS